MDIEELFANSEHGWWWQQNLEHHRFDESMKAACSHPMKAVLSHPASEALPEGTPPRPDGDTFLLSCCVCGAKAWSRGRNYDWPSPTPE